MEEVNAQYKSSDQQAFGTTRPYPREGQTWNLIAPNKILMFGGKIVCHFPKNSEFNQPLVSPLVGFGLRNGIRDFFNDVHLLNTGSLSSSFFNALLSSLLIHKFNTSFRHKCMD